MAARLFLWWLRNDGRADKLLPVPHHTAPIHAMSISFFCPEAPTVEVRPFAEEPDLVVHESTLPELNLSNTNAYALLRAAGLPTEYCGSWKNEDLPEIQSRLLRLVNSAEARKAAVRPTVVTHGELRATGTDGNVVEVGCGPTIISCGLDDEAVRARAERLLLVVSEARQYGGSVAWG